MRITFSAVLQECRRRGLDYLVEDQTYSVTGDTATERLHLSSFGRSACGVLRGTVSHPEQLRRLQSRHNRCQACWRTFSCPVACWSADASWEALAHVGSFMAFAGKMQKCRAALASHQVANLHSTLGYLEFFVDPVNFERERHLLHWKPLVDSITRDARIYQRELTGLLTSGANRKYWQEYAAVQHPAPENTWMLVGWSIPQDSLVERGWLGQVTTEMLSAWPMPQVHAHATHALVPAAVGVHLEHVSTRRSEQGASSVTSAPAPTDPSILETALGLWSPGSDSAMANMSAAVEAAHAVHTP